MNFFKWLHGIFHKEVEPRKVKIGLALGSGGAKGFVELGVLKALEENGIEADLVTGTSIGSIIGAFVADGYSFGDIYGILKDLNFKDLLSGKMPINMDMTHIEDFIDKQLGFKDIEELKKPYKAVATDLDTMQEVVLDSGSVALAVCSSSCYQPFFKPVKYKDKRLVDGAYCNSIPADLLKEMGADYIIGVDLANHENKVGFLGKFLYTLKGRDCPWDKGYENSNVLIHPDLSLFAPTQFYRGEEMLEVGYNEALKYIPKILTDIENLKWDGIKKPKEKTKKEKTKDNEITTKEIQ